MKKKTDKVDEISETLIEKSGLAGENARSFFKWSAKHGIMLTFGAIFIALLCLLAFGRGLLDPLYGKKKK